jgi:outer membrane protein assembly factor BamD (BamD/ComL family)
LTNVPIKLSKLSIYIGFLTIIILISGCSSSQSSRRFDEPYYRELSLFRRATDLLDDGQYAQANDLYSQFLHKYPKHPYSDDAAYRLAYMHVMADTTNPYLDYVRARTLFQKFIENYQNSHYITACKNWINLLDNCDKTSTTDSGNKNILTPNVNAQLTVEMEKLREENEKLRGDLEQLQKALER